MLHSLEESESTFTQCRVENIFREQFCASLESVSQQSTFYTIAFRYPVPFGEMRPKIYGSLMRGKVREWCTSLHSKLKDGREPQLDILDSTYANLIRNHFSPQTSDEIREISNAVCAMLTTQLFRVGQTNTMIYVARTILVSIIQTFIFCTLQRFHCCKIVRAWYFLPSYCLTPPSTQSADDKRNPRCASFRVANSTHLYRADCNSSSARSQTSWQRHICHLCPWRSRSWQRDSMCQLGAGL